MYCTKSSPDGPQENQLLIDLLWQKYLVKYNADALLAVSPMPGMLVNELDCRVIHLKSLIETLKRNNTPNSSFSIPIHLEIDRAIILINQLETFKSTLNEDLASDLNDQQIDEYRMLLTGPSPSSRPCQYFIRTCEQLLYYNQQAVFERYFPILQKKMDEWEEASVNTEKFQPKIVEAFQALEGDLGHLVFPSIPCRVGLIGNISVGKTSLLNWLRMQSVRSKDEEILLSPVRVGKSTYCRLEFEHEYYKEKKVIFVDIEGSTDTDTHLKSANYYDEISKADCDLYLIVFDNQFTELEHGWQRFIEETLKRQCWLVRNKVDEVFRRKFQENFQQTFDSSPETNRSKYGQKLFEQIRTELSKDLHGKELPNVYLTFTSPDENLLQLVPAREELRKLTANIQNLPVSLHNNRLQKMSLGAMARVINNSFRRGYVISVMKYQVAAGIAAVILFCDLIARYFGREAIRQAFGVNTRSHLLNRIRGTSDELKDYLKKFDIVAEHSQFQTSVFDRTIQRNPINPQTTSSNFASAAAKGATVAGVAGISLTDDIVRVSGVVTTTAVRGLSVAMIAAGAVLTVGMCAWAAVSNGQHLYDYLNRLCDDLILISSHLSEKIISDNEEVRERFLSNKKS